MEPGKELEDLCRKLSEDLLHIVDKDSGRPNVNRVIRTSDFYKGEYMDHLPDLLVEWSEEKLIGSKAGWRLGLSAAIRFRENWNHGGRKYLLQNRGP